MKKVTVKIATGPKDAVLECYDYENEQETLHADVECDRTGRFTIIFDYDEFKVIHDDLSDRYWYTDSDACHEVYPIARLYYHMANDIKLKQGEELSRLFDCHCCGEYVPQDMLAEPISYIWFKCSNP